MDYIAMTVGHWLSEKTLRMERLAVSGAPEGRRRTTRRLAWMVTKDPRMKVTESVYAGKQPNTFRIHWYFSVYDCILAFYIAHYYGVVHRPGFRSVIVRVRSYFSVFSCIQLRRYTIVILRHVKHRISPFTVVHERVCLIWDELQERYGKV